MFLVYLSIGPLQRQKKPVPCANVAEVFQIENKLLFDSVQCVFFTRWFQRPIFTIDGRKDVMFANSFLLLWKQVYTLKKRGSLHYRSDSISRHRAYLLSCSLIWFEIIPLIVSNKEERMLNFFANVKRWNKIQRGGKFFFSGAFSIFC